MYSSEPLPHFVDDYLRYLQEVHPTIAALDGVHTHDDLLEDISRTGVEADARALAGFARRLSEIPQEALTPVERVEHRILASHLKAKMFEIGRRSHLGAKPADLRRHPGVEPGRPGALRVRARDRACAPGPVEAAPGAAAHSGRPRQRQGSAGHLRQGRHRNLRGALRRSSIAICRARSRAWTTCTCSAISRMRRSKRRRPSAAMSSTWRRSWRPRRGPASASAGSSSSRNCKLEEGITLSAERLLAIAERELAETQEEFRKRRRAS